MRLYTFGWITFLLVHMCATTESARSSRRRHGRPSSSARESAKTQTGNVKNVDPDKYLEKFGYLPKFEGEVQHSPESRREAIRNFQRMTGLTVTGRLDSATRAKMLAPRCGMPDMVPEGSLPAGAQMAPTKGNRRLRPDNYFAPGYKWKKNRLTWKLTNYSPDLDRGAQRRAMYNAFNYWSSVSPLQFSETSSSDADIMIKFAYGNHGDGAGNSFDNQGGVLAHAYYPEDGDAHFDESEHWTQGTHEGTNLEIVAAHEFGHALGLDHSNVPGALMAPYYQGYDPNFTLHTDDIQGIQSLYGSTPRPRPTSRPAPRPRPTNRPPGKPSGKPNNCQTKFDAVLQDHNGKIYVFKGKWVWRLNYWEMESGFPVLARKVFDRPPLNIGAAVHSWRTRYTYFFKGNKIFKYYGFRRIERKTVRTRGYPTSIHASFMSRDGNIYLLQGNKYWIFDECRMTVRSAQGRPMSEKWPGVPGNMEAAVRLNDGYLYFIKGTRYRKYDEARRQVLVGYPKDKAPAWMGPEGGCSTQYLYK